MKKVIFLIISLAMFLVLGCGDDDIVSVEEGIIVVLYPDTTVTAYYDSSVEFTHYVWNTTDTRVKWYVDDIEGGNDSLGTIDSTGTYINEGNYLDYDEVLVKVLSLADTSKFDTVRVFLKDRGYVYVDIDGDDATGKGTKANPYRTITEALANSIQGQIVKLSEGTFYEGETFPLVPLYEVGVKGEDTSSTIVQPPTDAAAFQFQYEDSYIEDLSIVGQNKQGIGVQFGDPDNPDNTEGIDTLKTQNIVIENVHTAAVKSGQSTNISFTHNVVRNCVYGIVIESIGEDIILTGSSFTDIDSIAVNITYAITGTLDANSITINNVPIGVYIINGSSSLFINCTFSNIDSIGILNEGLADLQSGGGSNVFSGFEPYDWCFYNDSPNDVSAIGNTWPSADADSIDTYFIYDDDEDSSLGKVIFQQ